MAAHLPLSREVKKGSIYILFFLSHRVIIKSLLKESEFLIWIRVRFFLWELNWFSK